MNDTIWGDGVWASGVYAVGFWAARAASGGGSALAARVHRRNCGRVYRILQRRP